jgi:flagellar protein FlaG
MNIDHAKEVQPTPAATALRRPPGGAPERAPDRVPPEAASVATDPAEVDAAITAANQAVQSVATNLKFEKDSASGKTVVRVIDSETQQVLRQMPSEEMLAMSKALDRLHGLMVHLKV